VTCSEVGEVNFGSVPTVARNRRDEDGVDRRVENRGRRCERLAARTTAGMNDIVGNGEALDWMAEKSKVDTFRLFPMLLHASRGLTTAYACGHVSEGGRRGLQKRSIIRLDGP
jgi:hypothetical protein